MTDRVSKLCEISNFHNIYALYFLTALNNLVLRNANKARISFNLSGIVSSFKIYFYFPINADHIKK